MNDELVEAIKLNLAGLYGKMDPHDIDTKAVKTALCEACKSTGPVFTYATGVESPAADGGEFLFDVTGLLYDGDDYLKRAILIAESEWGNAGQIYEDFEKLLLARADVRAMIVAGGRPPGYRAIFETFAKYIARCEISEVGDIWLFAAWMPESFMFHRIDVFQNQRDLE